MIDIRIISTMSLLEINKKDRYEVKFEDGVKANLNKIEVSIISIVINNMLIYKDIVLTSELDIRKHYDDGYFTDDTLRRLMSSAYYMACGIHDDQSSLDIYRRGGMKTLNDVYNDIGYTVLDSMLSIDILDLIDIADHKDIVRVMKYVQEDMTVLSINKAYDTIGKVIRGYPIDTTNKAVIMSRIKAINNKQLFQIIGPRGFVAETDGSILETPITTGYLDGLDDIYKYTAESRTASVALMQADSNIAQSEYFARRMQLLTMTISTLHDTVCDTTNLMEWNVKSKQVDEDGNVLYVGDLSFMEGKLYKDKVTDKEYKTVSRDTKFPDGKIIHIRSATSCTHPDEYGICKDCLGRLSLNIPFHYNIGHLGSTILSSKMTQKMLNVKHVIMSLFATALKLEESHIGILNIREDGFSLDNDKLSSYDKIECVVAMDQVTGIDTLNRNTNIGSLDPQTLSSVSDATFRLVKGTTETIKHIILSQDSTNAVLSRQTLAYIVKPNNLFIRDNKYVIDLSRWTINKNLFDIPNTEYSHFDLMQQVKTLLLKRSVLKGGVSRDDVEGLIKATFRLVNSKLDVNLAMIEVIVYGLTVKDMGNNDYRLGRHSDNVQLGNETNLSGYRSLGGRLGSGRLGKYVFSTRAIRPLRPNHPLDFIFFKQETIDTIEARRLKYNIDTSFIHKNALKHY